MPFALSARRGGASLQGRARRAALGLLVLGAGALGGCATYASELERGHRHYEVLNYDEAIATFRALEPDLPRLTIKERAYYAYSRGITAYRIAGRIKRDTPADDPRRGYRREARHWLALAEAYDRLSSGGLNEGQKARVALVLVDLNQELHGTEASANGAVDEDGQPVDDAPRP